MKTRCQLIDRCTGETIFTNPADFEWMTEAAIYAIQHDLIHAEVKLIATEQNGIQSNLVAIES